MIFELFAKIIIYITKACFKALIVGVLLFLVVYNTNVGGSMDVIKEKYYSVTGSELSPSDVLVDLEDQVDDSVNNIEGVSKMFDQQGLVNPNSQQ
ncbi:hypothetical protein CVD28_24925 [Bacillus sp. M6-12]|uniref:hypothetical protein n=1 Tax=Bacillus sp. M6-12 TaxID=2054166 RepID=UPI000C75F7AF|nr:hypothetical protein [Bacillus sp. M6-12]PLS15081.1 hypothetical protein CVD28_24925 [Bacillus sp. M6-12]